MGYIANQKAFELFIKIKKIIKEKKMKRKIDKKTTNSGNDKL